MDNKTKDLAVRCAEQIAKYGFMTAFAMSFPRDEALIHHNLECLNMIVKELNEVVEQCAERKRNG